MQYVAVKFAAEDKRTYTYHNEGEPVAVGDRVDVMSRGSKPCSVTVTEVTNEKPPYATKAIIGKSAPKEEPRDLLDEQDGDDLNNERGDLS